MKILLVGLGRWGEKHLRVLTELGVELWVADLSEERRSFALRAGVAPTRAVQDFRAALPHVAAVDLVTPADNHLALASECLRAGKDCFVEKPLALTVAEGQALAAEAQRSAGRILQVGHIFRFHPVTDVLRQRLVGGEVGPVRYCTGRFAGFKRPRADVGVTLTDAIHYFDLFAYLLGPASSACPPGPLGVASRSLAACRRSARRGTFRRAPTETVSSSANGRPWPLISAPPRCRSTPIDMSWDRPGCKRPRAPSRR